MSGSICRFAAAAFTVALFGSALPAVAADSDWAFGATVYGWFPDISGNVGFRDDTGGRDFEVEIGDILDNLEFTFQGGLDVRKGRWGAVTDVIYMSVGKTQRSSRDGTLGGTQIPTDVSARLEFDMKSWIWTAAGYYRALDESSHTVDLLAGFRYLDVDQTLDWSLTGNLAGIPVLDREGSGEAKLQNWDFIVGLRGRFTMGADGSWFLPYVFDVGAGDSDLTWQAAAGLGYRFGWGEILGVWRHLSYEMDTALSEMEFSGPAIGATFRW
jgi:hypothetical protein